MRASRTSERSCSKYGVNSSRSDCEATSSSGCARQSLSARVAVVEARLQACARSAVPAHRQAGEGRQIFLHGIVEP